MDFLKRPVKQKAETSDVAKNHPGAPGVASLPGALDVASLVVVHAAALDVASLVVVHAAALDVASLPGAPDVANLGVVHAAVLDVANLVVVPDVVVHAAAP